MSLHYEIFRLFFYNFYFFNLYFWDNLSEGGNRLLFENRLFSVFLVIRNLKIYTNFFNILSFALISFENSSTYEDKSNYYYYCDEN